MGSSPGSAKALDNLTTRPAWARITSLLAHRMWLAIIALLWPDASWLMHAQNLAWYAALIATVGWVVGRIGDTPWAGGVAALVFALDELHAESVGWIACRNGLMASVFALSALIVHHRWRRESVRRGRWLAPALLGTGLLSGELALGGVGYLVSYACLWERGSVRERALSVLPYVALTATWVLIYADSHFERVSDSITHAYADSVA